MRGSVAGLLLLALCASVELASAQPKGWRHVPSITVVGADASDVRLGLLEEAAAFWNRTFEELDSGFRLGGAPMARGAWSGSRE